MKNKSGLWNATFGEIGATLKILEDNGVSLESFANLRSNQQLAQDVACLIMGKDIGVLRVKKGVTSKDEFLIPIDYSKSLEEMLFIAGYVDDHKKNIEINPSMQSNKSKEAEEITVKLFHFYRRNSRNNVIGTMDKEGYRCAVLFELLALNQAKPELRSKFRIVALGSKWGTKGSPSLIGFPYLRLNSRSGDPIDVFLHDDDYDDNTFCYLGVLK